MIRLWRMSQGGMAGPGPLPEAGGVLDQAAIMLQAFGIMNAAEKELKDEG
jgi:hypothetical protein